MFWVGSWIWDLEPSSQRFFSIKILVGKLGARSAEKILLLHYWRASEKTNLIKVPPSPRRAETKIKIPPSTWPQKNKD